MECYGVLGDGGCCCRRWIGAEVEFLLPAPALGLDITGTRSTCCRVTKPFGAMPPLALAPAPASRHVMERFSPLFACPSERSGQKVACTSQFTGRRFHIASFLPSFLSSPSVIWFLLSFVFFYLRTGRLPWVVIDVYRSRCQTAIVFFRGTRWNYDGVFQSRAKPM